MINPGRPRNQSRSTRSMPFSGLEYADPKKKGNLVGKILLAAALTALCIIMLKQSPSFNTTNVFSKHEQGVTHVLVTGGAGYIGSHAALRLLKDKYRVTIVDNLSRGNLGAVKVYKNYFQNQGGFSSFMPTWGMQKLYPHHTSDKMHRSFDLSHNRHECLELCLLNWYFRLTKYFQKMHLML
ncbi:hypothetical protein Dsin_032841 [Dipteronia sinensis]|uniref:NAD-dependent epimerase/dehydratase domain-containing protein n=1 Tax=Dipteronia sinensis TaxID=43782 RepID=A0AAE0DMD3_9ROSI|nr:hypothetical protein Dsin_032841 [Dipteronia sinensis]